MGGLPVAPAAGRSNEELRLAAIVGRVIDTRQVTTVFQPLVDLSSTEIVGYEAFCRGPGHLAPDDPLAREWKVIVLGPHYAVAVTARALDDPAAGDNRRFEYVVTHDRDLIIRAALVLWARIPKREPTIPG